MKPWILHPSPTGSVLHVVSDWPPGHAGRPRTFKPLCVDFTVWPWDSDRVVMTYSLETEEHSPVCTHCASKVEMRALSLAKLAGILIKHRHGNRTGRAR